MSNIKSTFPYSNFNSGDTNDGTQKKKNFFVYKVVKGLKEGSDCAICLHEFQAEDKLRFLPKCSYDFHLECIDT